MSGSDKCLSPARLEEVRTAFFQWYEAQSNKRIAFLSLGVLPGNIGGYTSSFRSKLRIPPPWLLARLWKQTQDPRFLFSEEEKRRKLGQGRLKGLPSKEDWPDREDQTLHSVADPSVEPPQSPVVQLTTLLDAYGGETSPLGVERVLGTDSFVQIDLDPTEDLIVLIERLVETLRGLLNLLAQIRDDHTRGNVRRRIGPQIEELELAIRMFSSVHPNRLTQLHDAQRSAWIGNSSKK